MKIDRRTVLGGLGSSLAIPIVLTPGTAEAKRVLTLVKRVRLGTQLPGDVTNPHVATLPDGGFIASWINQPVPGTSYAYVRFYDSGGAPISGNLKLQGGTTTGVNAESIQVVSTGGGRAFALFTAKTIGATGLDATDIYLQKFAANHAASGTPIRVNTTPSNSEDTVCATRLSNGKVLVVWNTQGSTTDSVNVVGRVIAPDGTMLTAEKVLTNTTTGVQVLSCLAAIDNGKAIFTYYTFASVSTSLKFYAQTLNANADRVGAPRLIKSRPSVIAGGYGSVGVFYLPEIGVVYTWYKKVPPPAGAELAGDFACIVYQIGGAIENVDLFFPFDEGDLERFPVASPGPNGNLLLATTSIDQNMQALVTAVKLLTGKVVAGPQAIQTADNIPEVGFTDSQSTVTLAECCAFYSSFNDGNDFYSSYDCYDFR